MVHGVAKSGTRLSDSYFHYPLVSNGGSNLNKTFPGSWIGLWGDLAHRSVSLLRPPCKPHNGLDACLCTSD